MQEAAVVSCVCVATRPTRHHKTPNRSQPTLERRVIPQSTAPIRECVVSVSDPELFLDMFDLGRNMNVLVCS